MIKKRNKKEEEFKKIKMIASFSDKAAQMELLPKTPGIKKHQRRDIQFHLNKEDEKLEKVKDKRKIVL
jgi:phage repressor protein C with HTH and peptisase S24 domain